MALELTFTNAGELRISCNRCGNKTYYSANKTVRFIYADYSKHRCDYLGTHDFTGPKFATAPGLTPPEYQCSRCHCTISTIETTKQTCNEAQGAS